MSKWGYVDTGTAKRWGINRAAEAVYEMAKEILSLENDTNDLNREIRNLTNKLLEKEEQLGRVGGELWKLRGYIERVRETDKKMEQPHD